MIIRIELFCFVQAAVLPCHLAKLEGRQNLYQNVTDTASGLLTESNNWGFDRNGNLESGGNRNIELLPSSSVQQLRQRNCKNPNVVDVKRDSEAAVSSTVTSSSTSSSAPATNVTSDNILAFVGLESLVQKINTSFNPMLSPLPLLPSVALVCSPSSSPAYHLDDYDGFRSSSSSKSQSGGPPPPSSAPADKKNDKISVRQFKFDAMYKGYVEAGGFPLKPILDPNEPKQVLLRQVDYERLSFYFDNGFMAKDFRDERVRVEREVAREHKNEIG